MNTLRHSLRLRLAVILVGVTAGIIIIGTIINSVFLGNYYITTKLKNIQEVSLFFPLHNRHKMILYS